MTKQHFGYSKNPAYDALIHKLGEVVLRWRSTKSDEVAQQYREVLNTLLLLGWRGELDVDIELPDRLRPDEYLAQFK